MQSIKLSIIVPVFNAETYIDACVESVLDQTLNDIEIIFVNDGSTDHSKEIIEKYKKLDARIKLVNQVNQGVSIARNNGLLVAVGEYVGFVDADDYLEKDMFEILYRTAKKDDYDVVISNFESELGGHKVVTRYPFPIETTLTRDYIEREILTFFLKSDQLNTACNKIYRREIATNYDVRFPEKVTLGEDGVYNIQFFKYSSKVIYIDYTGYHYREVQGSATRNIMENDYFKRAVEVYTIDIPDLASNNLDPDKIKQLKSVKLINSVIANIYVYLNGSQNLGLTKRMKYVSEMIRNSYVREALPIYYYETYGTLSRYEKFIIEMIRRKSMIGLFCATSYSRMRNKSN